MITGTALGFGERLKHLRIAAGLSQEALAERAHLSARAISDLERDPKRTPRRDSIQLLAEALGLSAQDKELLEETVVHRRSPVRLGHRDVIGGARHALERDVIEVVPNLRAGRDHGDGWLEIAPARPEVVVSLGQDMAKRRLMDNIVIHHFKQNVAHTLLSENIKTMNFREEWQFIVNRLVSETNVCLRAMVFDVELSRWWSSVPGRLYMTTNLDLLKRRVAVKRIFVLTSFDMRVRRNALLTAYLHHKLGIHVKVCEIASFQGDIPFTPDMFSVHDNMFVTLYYLGKPDPITNILLDGKYITEFQSFYDDIFDDDRLCVNIEALLMGIGEDPSFLGAIDTQMRLLERLSSTPTAQDFIRGM